MAIVRCADSATSVTLTRLITSNAAPLIHPSDVTPCLVLDRVTVAGVTSAKINQKLLKIPLQNRLLAASKQE